MLRMGQPFFPCNVREGRLHAATASAVVSSAEGLSRFSIFDRNFLGACS